MSLNQRLIKQLARKKENRICFDCALKHKVKGISMTNFKDKEIQMLKELGGNEEARKKWREKHNPNTYPFPRPNDEHRIKKFVEETFLKKRWCSEEYVKKKVNSTVPVLRINRQKKRASEPKVSSTPSKRITPSERKKEPLRKALPKKSDGKKDPFGDVDPFDLLVFEEPKPAKSTAQSVKDQPAKAQPEKVEGGWFDAFVEKPVKVQPAKVQPKKAEGGWFGPMEEQKKEKKFPDLDSLFAPPTPPTNPGGGGYRAGYPMAYPYGSPPYGGGPVHYPPYGKGGPVRYQPLPASSQPNVPSPIGTTNPFLVGTQPSSTSLSNPNPFLSGNSHPKPSTNFVWDSVPSQMQLTTSTAPPKGDTGGFIGFDEFIFGGPLKKEKEPPVEKKKVPKSIVPSQMQSTTSTAPPKGDGFSDAGFDEFIFGGPLKKELPDVKKKVPKSSGSRVEKKKEAEKGPKKTRASESTLIPSVVDRVSPTNKIFSKKVEMGRTKNLVAVEKTEKLLDARFNWKGKSLLVKRDRFFIDGGEYKYKKLSDSSYMSKIVDDFYIFVWEDEDEMLNCFTLKSSINPEIIKKQEDEEEVRSKRRRVWTEESKWGVYSWMGRALDIQESHLDFNRKRYSLRKITDRIHTSDIDGQIYLFIWGDSTRVVAVDGEPTYIDRIGFPKSSGSRAEKKKEAEKGPPKTRASEDRVSPRNKIFSKKVEMGRTKKVEIGRTKNLVAGNLDEKTEKLLDARFNWKGKSLLVKRDRFFIDGGEYKYKKLTDSSYMSKIVDEFYLFVWEDEDEMLNCFTLKSSINPEIIKKQEDEEEVISMREESKWGVYSWKGRALEIQESHLDFNRKRYSLRKITDRIHSSDIDGQIYLFIWGDSTRVVAVDGEPTYIERIRFPGIF